MIAGTTPIHATADDGTILQGTVAADLNSGGNDCVFAFIGVAG